MTANNLGAISALKGYRVQFLYSLARILSCNEHEAEFHPEGEFEDLDVYNEKGEVVEIIQVKDLGQILTLSDIITSKKENTFLKRAYNTFKTHQTPKIKLVSFGEVNDDIKALSAKYYSKELIIKLKKQGLNNDEIETIKGNFYYEVVDEQNVNEIIISNIEKWGTYADFDITLDLLQHAIYYAAENRQIITPVSFKAQFLQICQFQVERINFNKAYNILIKTLDNTIENEDKDRLKSDFYKGISATYKHILAEVDVPRFDKLKAIKEKFKESNVLFIQGASGQGKSTLAYRYLHNYCSQTTVFELKQLPENITTIYEVINALEGISKGIRFPITIYIDVESGNKGWVAVLRELASKKNFNFLVTIRKEDWNSTEIGDKFSFSEIELLFEQEEAELIYDSLNEYKTDLKFPKFEDAWGKFGGNGPLLEFVYLITQNETLSEKLKFQINKIRSDSSDIGKEKIKLLRYIVLADSFGSKIKLKEINQFLKPEVEIHLLIDLLQNEYLIQISGDKYYISGLHPVRSKIIKELLFDPEINIESDYVINALPFISDNTIQYFLRNAFRQSKLSPDELLKRLNTFEPQKWQIYLQIFNSLLWKGIEDYVNKNINPLNKIYEDYNKGWKIVANFDFSNIIEGGSLMENSDIFTEEQRKYAKAINEEFSDKTEVFAYCIFWLKNIKQINIVPNSKDEWDGLGLFLFWLQYFNNKAVVLNYNKFEIEKTLSDQPLDVIAHVLYAFKKYNSKSLQLVEKVEKLFLQKISETYSIISIEQEDCTIICHYLFDIIDEKIDTVESDFANAKSVKIIELLRFAFPDNEYYGTKGVGHQFSFLPNNHDSSIKKISRKSLPLNPLVEINSAYINLFEYTQRPNSWQEYISKVITRRLLFIEIMSKMIKAFNLYHTIKNLKPLAEYGDDYIENYQSLIKGKSMPTLPQLIIDEWGEYGEGNSIRIKSNFDQPIEENNKEKKQILSVRRYDNYRSLYQNLDVSIENFLMQSAKSVFRKIKVFLNEDVSDMQDNGRVALVLNLFKAYELIVEFQNSFRFHFEKFIDPIKLNKIEKDEIEIISILCVLYRQFMNSDTFLNGNVRKLALDRLKDTEITFKKKITIGIKQLAKELCYLTKVEFDEREKRCVIIVEHNNAIESFELLKIIYNKLFEFIGQPDYASIKYLIISTKYPVFNVVLLVNGKTINSKWNEFKAYNLREKKFEELEQFNLISQDIPLDIIEKYNITSWNKTLEEFKNLDRLLESASTANQLAYHMSQLKYFRNRIVEDYNEKILQNYMNKTSVLFNENLQTAIDLSVKYKEMCDNEEIHFSDENEKQVFCEFLIDNHRNFYPSEDMYEKGEFGSSIGIGEMETWTPRLEKLVNNISVIYYFLAGKIIEGKNQSFP